MQDIDKTKAQLIEELLVLRRSQTDATPPDGTRRSVSDINLRYRTLVDTIPHGIQENDLNGIITFSNRAHHRMYGCDPGEMYGKTIWHFQISELEKKKLRDYLGYLIKEQPKPTPYFTQSITNTGRLINVKVDWAYLWNPQHQLCGFVSVITDITEDQQLKKQQQFHDEILQNIAESVHLVRKQDGIIVYTSPKFELLFGYQPGEMLGQHVSMLNEAADKASAQQTNKIIATLNRKGWWNGEVCNRKKDGSTIWCRAAVSTFEHPEFGSVWLSVHEDITHKKLAEQALIKSEKKYRELFEKSKDAILIIENGKFVDCNQATLDMLGYQHKQDMLQTHPSKLSPEFQADGRASVEKADEMMHIALTQGSNRFEWLHVRANGRVFPVEVLLTPITTESDTQVIHTVWRDITLQKQQQERILHQAQFDNLTDLPNRFFALERLTQMIAEAQRHQTCVAVLFLDLDNFKKINDTMGHDCGDKMLIQAAERLSTQAPEGSIVARLGGDEFIMLLGGLAEVEQSRSIATRLVKLFQEPMLIDERELILTASLGIACFPDDGSDATELLRKADIAMYHSKAQGRNGYHYFTPQMNSEVARRLLLEEHLHGALARNEFHVCYQPVISIAERKIIGAEALVRWHNPTLGNVFPDEFIPLTEQSGYIVQIGQYVLQQALTLSTQWQQRYGRNLKMAVNLSPRQFRDPQFLEHIKATMNQFGVSGGSIELEITEGVLLTGQAIVDDTLKALNELGVSLAMDDFGTGYSSMSYLRLYPFDTLKIDRSFVKDLIEDKGDRELVNATIAMAHSLGLKVVAEGVETEAQLAYLKHCGCELAQGYLFSKPLLPAEFEKLLESWS